MFDLFGGLLDAPTSGPKIGYAARPGTGPKGQRCNTCKHAQRVLSQNVRSWKCELMARLWSVDRNTDIKPGAPACSEWERKPYTDELLKNR